MHFFFTRIPFVVIKYYIIDRTITAYCFFFFYDTRDNVLVTINQRGRGGEGLPSEFHLCLIKTLTFFISHSKNRKSSIAFWRRISSWNSALPTAFTVKSNRVGGLFRRSTVFLLFFFYRVTCDSRSFKRMTWQWDNVVLIAYLITEENRLDFIPDGIYGILFVSDCRSAGYDFIFKGVSLSYVSVKSRYRHEKTK